MTTGASSFAGVRIRSADSFRRPVQHRRRGVVTRGTTPAAALVDERGCRRVHMTATCRVLGINAIALGLGPQRFRPAAEEPSSPSSAASAAPGLSAAARAALWHAATGSPRAWRTAMAANDSQTGERRAARGSPAAEPSRIRACLGAHPLRGARRVAERRATPGPGGRRATTTQGRTARQRGGHRLRSPAPPPAADPSA